MWREFFASQPLAPLGLVGMVVFLGTFLIAVLHALRLHGLESAARAGLPLDDEMERRS